MNIKYTPKTLIFLCIGLLFMFGFGTVCPTWSTVTPDGINVLGVFFGWIFLTVAGFGLMVPSLLSLFALALTGFYTSAEILSGFANPIALLCMFGMALVYAFSESKGGEVLVRYLISRKFLNGHPVRFLLMFFLALAVLGVFMDMGAFFLGLAFVDSIAAVLGYEEDSNWKRFMLTVSLVVSLAGSAVLPSKAAPLLTLGAVSGTFAEAGITANSVAFIAVTLVAVLLFAVTLALLAKPLFKIDLEKMKSLDVTDLVKGENSIHLNKKQIIAGILMVVGFSFPLLLMPFVPNSPVTLWLNRFGQVLFMAMLLALLHLIHINGEPVCDSVAAFGKGVVWDVYVGIVAVVAVSGALASANSGINTWLSSIIGGLFQGMSFPVMILVVTVLCGAVTQIFSNTATMVIVSSIIAQFLIPLANQGVEVTVFPALIAQVTMLGALTPAASGYAAMMLALPPHQANRGWILKWGPLVILVYILCAVPAGILVGYAF